MPRIRRFVDCTQCGMPVIKHDGSMTPTCDRCYRRRHEECTLPVPGQADRVEVYRLKLARGERLFEPTPELLGLPRHRQSS